MAAVAFCSSRCGIQDRAKSSAQKQKAVVCFGRPSATRPGRIFKENPLLALPSTTRKINSVFSRRKRFASSKHTSVCRKSPTFEEISVSSSTKLPIFEETSVSSWGSSTSKPVSNTRKVEWNLHSCAIMVIQGIPSVLLNGIQDVLQQDHPTWTSSIAANAVFYIVGFPLLRTGLTAAAIASAFVLGTLTWKAFGLEAFLLLVIYFIVGTGVTKVKIKEKEREGIAEKRSGKRGPSSVWGSGAAGIACSLAAITGLGGSTFSYFWQLGFAASFATKLSDTVSSEIGKAYGTTTYLVTTLKLVPRGTDGAISLEGTLAGLSASILFCALAYNVNQITARDALICVLASQFANLLESYAGATIQDKKGFEWLNNDAVNVINISFGATIAILASYVTSLL